MLFFLHLYLTLFHVTSLKEHISITYLIHTSPRNNALSFIQFSLVPTNKNGFLMDLNGRRIYPFNKGLRIYGGVYHPPFDTLNSGTSTDDIKLKLYR